MPENLDWHEFWLKRFCRRAHAQQNSFNPMRQLKVAPEKQYHWPQEDPVDETSCCCRDQPVGRIPRLTCVAKLLQTDLNDIRVARLQNEVGTKCFFSRHGFSHEKCSEFFLPKNEPLFCASEKIPQNSRRKNSLPIIKKITDELLQG